MGISVKTLKEEQNADLLSAYESKLNAPLSPITSDSQCDSLNDQLDEWINQKASMENVEAIKIMSEVIKHSANLINTYEINRFKFEKNKPAEILKTLIQDNGLKQRDLAIHFGSQSIVSEVLNGKREISISTAKKLGSFFRVSPSLFIEIDF
ncbi:MAG: transcriptional regulator [Bdellovibrionaceae bacterium]|nr:transcriptional regulator [Pseudobdellovibrionaceae bacterium]|tara:strand:+ start:1918 stop:2373 length:456 start_codon:yes stop_codon:yes gene_type:complete